MVEYAGCPKDSGERYLKKASEKSAKKFLRNFKKVLDKREMMWYNSQAVHERIANGH